MLCISIQTNCGSAMAAGWAHHRYRLQAVAPSWAMPGQAAPGRHLTVVCWCTSEAPSLTCSMYTLVRLGMFKGMSCSGGGPEAWLLTSSDALLGSILTSSAPAQQQES